MNYIGSKFTLSSWIKDEICKIVGNNLSDKIFCDLFAGTGIVGRTFKTSVKKVISNDIEPYAYALNRNYIANREPIKNTADLIEELNSLKPKNGFIFENYCIGSGSGRQYFSDENGRKIDAIRSAINERFVVGEINENAYYFLLASLIECADKVANTASVYGAFLKTLKKSAQKPLVLEPANFELNENSHEVYQMDANELIRQISGDILYLDPPYNHREYGANYHILNTIALYDEFEPRGKTGLREYKKSAWCKKQTAAAEFEELIKNANFRYIFLSYNNEGIILPEQIRQIMQKYGKYDLATKEYQRFRADKVTSRNHKADKTIEFLHILQKTL